MKKKKHTLILGSYGRGNIGDDIFLYVLAKKLDDHILYANCYNPDLLSDEIRLIKNITFLPTGFWAGALLKLRILLRIETIIYGGGNVWVELYGSFFLRRILYSMLIINTLARVCGKKIVYLGVGSGNISGWSLLLAKLCVKLAHDVYVRDSKSKEILDLSKTHVVPDMASVLGKDPIFAKQKKNNSSSRTIVISLLHALPEPREMAWRKLKKDIIQFINTYPEKNVRFVILPMYRGNDIHNDYEMAKQLIPLSEKHISIWEDRSLQSLGELLSSADLIIATRLHANITAVLCETPTIGIAYREKVFDFFVDAKMSDYCLFLTEIKTLPEIVSYIFSNYKKAREDVTKAKELLVVQSLLYEKIFRSL